MIGSRDDMHNRVRKHTKACVDLFNIQREHGLYFVHENVVDAHSWMQVDMLALISHDDVHSYIADEATFSSPSGMSIGGQMRVVTNAPLHQT